jgi:hypothetical protein
MAENDLQVSTRPLSTPRAAAIAGILFSLLYGTSYTLIQLAIPALSQESTGFSEDQIRLITLGLSFLPFAGIAFLWFMGVIRERMGAFEDQFFSTLFLGSGLLYLGFTLMASAVGGGILVAYSIDPDIMINSDAFLLGRSITNRLTTIYAIRMAGMFMIVLGTIWVRTRIMPRWLALVTYILAAVLLISVGFTHWVILIFPAWVLVISAYILYLNFLFQKGDLDIEGLTLED